MSNRQSNEWRKFVTIVLSGIKDHPDLKYTDSIALGLGSHVHRAYEEWEMTSQGNSAPFDTKVNYFLDFWRNTKSNQEIGFLVKDFLDLLEHKSDATNLRQKVESHFRNAIEAVDQQSLQHKENDVIANSKDSSICLLCRQKVNNINLDNHLTDFHQLHVDMLSFVKWS